MRKNLILFSLLALVVVAAPAQAALIYLDTSDYIGSRSTSGTNEVVGNGDYSGAGIDSKDHGFQINWDISFDPISFLYTYKYTLSGANGTTLGKDISHFIIQVTDGSPICDFNSTTSGEIGYYDSTTNGNSNPGMGGEIYGIKWAGSEGDTYSVTFTTTHAPVWGDFYAKDGNDPPMSYAQNYALWHQPNLEPGDPGWSKLWFVATPDGELPPPSGNVPLPPSVLLMGSGLFGLGLLGWRQRGKA
jgi:hypothetical protein